MKYTISILLLWLVLPVFYLNAQLPQYQLSKVTEQEGLHTADIVNLQADEDGFMWIATQTQVQKFDGRRADFFTFNESIYQVYVDALNRKWVVGSRSLYLKQPGKREFVKVECNTPDSLRPFRIFERGPDSLIVLYSNGFHLYNSAGNCLVRLPKTISHLTKPFQIPFLKTDLFEYWTTADSVFQYNPGDGSYRSFPFTGVHSISAAGSKAVFVSTYSFNTTLIDDDGVDIKSFLAAENVGQGSGKKIIIFNSVPISEDKLLISSNMGLIVYCSVKKKMEIPSFYFQGEPLRNQPSVRYLYKAKDGMVYLCHADGIFMLRPNARIIQYVRNYQWGNNKLPDNDVRSFDEDEKGNIWMATIGGIGQLNMATGKAQSFIAPDINNQMEYPSYRQVVNHKEYIWVGTSGQGVWLLHKETGKFRRPVFETGAEGKYTEALMNGSYVWEILKLRSGLFMVVCGGLSFLIDPNTLLCKQLLFSSSRESSRSARQDSSGRIWHGTARGLTCLDSNFNRLFSIRDSFPDLRIAAICEWKQNTMLVGTKGLYEVQVEGNDIISFRKRQGLPAVRFVYCMQQDKQGFVWIGTDDGLYRYDPVRDESMRFDQSDYIQSQAFNSDAAFLSSSGILFMGGKNGFNYLDPSAIKPVSHTLQPRIVHFMVDGITTTFATNPSFFSIGYHQRNISFTMSAPVFKNPFSLKYRYRLSKDKKEWVENGFSETVRINNLEPGRYSLQVSASLDGNIWYDGSGVLAFVVQKPWWQTWVFRLLCLAIAAFAWWVYVRYRNNKTEEAEMKAAINYFALSSQQQASTVSILWDIARNCISRLGFTDCVIYLVDEERNMLVQKAAYGDKSPKDYVIANPIEIPLGQGITGYAAQHSATVLVSDTTKDNRYIIDDETRSSELAVPIIHEGRVIGIIDSEHSKKHFFKEKHRQILEHIAAICAAKIARSIAEESMKAAEYRLAELNTRMMESRFMNLRLQMNPHFLFNTLTSIQYLVVSGQTSKASKYLNVFSGFLRALLQYAEVNVVTLSDELRILRMYVELESLSLDETFIYEINMDEDMEPDECDVPFMLLQPFVENAILHGLQHRVGEKRFSVNIESNEEENIVCIIEDNGVGRKRAAEINEAKMRNALHQSKGISIVEQRLALLQEKTGKLGGVAYEDLYNAKGEPAGTRVTITIPHFNKNEV